MERRAGIYGGAPRKINRRCTPHPSPDPNPNPNPDRDPNPDPSQGRLSIVATSADAAEVIREVVDEVLEGPAPEHLYTDEEYGPSASAEAFAARPDHAKEIDFFKAPLTLTLTLTLPHRETARCGVRVRVRGIG